MKVIVKGADDDDDLLDVAERGMERKCNGLKIRFKIKKIEGFP